MSAIRKPTVTRPVEGRTIGVVGDVYRFLVTGAETNGQYAMWEALVPPGGGPPPHLHSREEESFYILEGEIRFQLATRRSSPQQGCSPTCPSVSALFQE